MMRWLVVLAVLLTVGPIEGQATDAPSALIKDCRECPELVLIPAGSFMMGAAIGEEDAEDVPQELRGWSRPRHTVTIPAAFYLGRDHVTRGQFAAFVKATRAMISGCRGGEAWHTPLFPQTDDDPVVCVDAHDADAYVRWLSTMTGNAYRLPSEAEWEYAARAGTTGVRYWGSDASSLCRHAAVGGCRLTGTVPVGRFVPNPYGLHDMLGEAWQWMADCWNDSYADAPADGSPWLHGNCDLRVVRGGAWSTAAWTVRAAERDAYGTNYRASDVGFRVARTATP